MAGDQFRTKDEPEYWTSIKPKDFLTLTDYASVEAAGVEGVDYEVTGIRRVRVQDQESSRTIIEYHLHDLKKADGSASLCFVVIAAGEDFELRLYFVPSGFAPGTRDELIDAGTTWFFLPPPNPEDFISSDLEFAPYPDVPPIDENGRTVKREFSFSGMGRPLYGAYGGRDDEVPVIVVEYATSDPKAANPHLLIVEERWMLHDGTIPESGGLVTAYLGCAMSADNVDVFPASAR